MARWMGYLRSMHARALAGAVAGAVASTLLTVPVLTLVGSAGAVARTGTSGLVVKVSPDKGLVNGREVTVSGHGLTRASGGNALTWFVTECTAAVHGRMHPATDTPNCDVTDAKGIKVGHDGTFSTRFRVRAGVIGDGYCGTAGHTGCVIGVSTAKGEGTVVKISFAVPATATSKSTTAG